MLLVTGATGTIGRPLIDALLNQGAKVRAITHNPHAAGLPAEVEVVEADPRPPRTHLCRVGRRPRRRLPERTRTVGSNR
ncbi:MAG TPA: NAD(P)H-binding protein [Actinomycetes bacterium]|nr:NAD(P)H-binding protein [Actinomycetes bacterium]